MNEARLLHFGTPVSVLTGTITYSATGGTATGYLKSPDPSVGGFYPLAVNGEPDGMILDGEYDGGQYFGFISTAASDPDDGTFGTNPTLTMNVTGIISGVTLIFGNGEGCAVTVQFYNGGTLLGTKTATATGRVLFVSGAGGITKVVVTFNRTLIPGTRVKVARLFPGEVHEFDSTEITACDATKECNLGGLELPAGTLTATIASDAPAKFKYRELLLAFWGDRLIGHFYVDKVKKIGAELYSISAVDALGVLATTPFDGQYMASDTDVQDEIEALATSSFSTAVDHLHIYNVRGLVTATNRRDALLQVGIGGCLWGAARPPYNGLWPPNYGLDAPISFDDVLDVLDPANANYETVDLDPDEIYDSVDFSEDVVVTSLEITSHAITTSATGNIQIGNARYNDTMTANTYTVSSAGAGLPNVRKIGDALTIITGKKDAAHTYATDVALIGAAVSDYLKKQKRIIITAANKFIDLGCRLRATIDGVTYTAAVEKINYRFGSSIMAATYTAVVIKEA